MTRKKPKKDKATKTAGYACPNVNALLKTFAQVEPAVTMQVSAKNLQKFIEQLSDELDYAVIPGDVARAVYDFTSSLIASIVVDKFGNTLVKGEFFTLDRYSDSRASCYKVDSAYPVFVNSTGLELETVDLHCDFDKEDVGNGLPKSNFLVIVALAYEFNDSETQLVKAEENPVIVSLQLLRNCGVKTVSPANLCEVENDN